MALVGHAPYRRLRRGLLGESVAAMRSMLGSIDGERRDVQLRTAVMSCLALLVENPLTLADLMGEGGVVLAPLASRAAGGRGPAAVGGGGGSAEGGGRGGYGSWGPVVKDCKRTGSGGGSTAGGRISEGVGGRGAGSSGDDRGNGNEGSAGGVDVLLMDLVMVVEGVEADANPVKVEALRAISGIVRHSCPAVLARWGRLGPLLKQLLQSAPLPIRTHSARVVEGLVGATEEREEEEEEGEGQWGDGRSLLDSPARRETVRRSEGDEREVDTGAGKAGRGVEGGERDACGKDGTERLPESLWEELMEDIIPLMLEDESSSVRSSAMAAIACVPTGHAKFPALLDAVWAEASPGDNKMSAARGAALKVCFALRRVCARVVATDASCACPKWQLQM